MSCIVDDYFNKSWS